VRLWSVLPLNAPKSIASSASEHAVWSRFKPQTYGVRIFITNQLHKCFTSMSMHNSLICQRDTCKSVNVAAAESRAPRRRRARF
jgi:hypothetical protein